MSWAEGEKPAHTCLLHVWGEERDAQRGAESSQKWWEIKKEETGTERSNDWPRVTQPVSRDAGPNPWALSFPPHDSASKVEWRMAASRSELTAWTCSWPWTCLLGSPSLLWGSPWRLPIIFILGPPLYSYLPLSGPITYIFLLRHEGECKDHRYQPKWTVFEWLTRPWWTGASYLTSRT